MTAYLLAAMMILSWNPFEMEVPAVRRGNEAMRAGKYAQAEKEYRAALAQRAGDPRIIYDLGLALLGQGKYEDAITQFEAAQTTNNTELSYQARFHAGIAKFHLGDKGMESYRPMRADIQTSFNEFESAQDQKTKVQAAQKTLKFIGMARKILKKSREHYSASVQSFTSALGVKSEEEAIYNRELAMARQEKVDDELEWLDELEDKLRDYMKKQQNQKKNQQQKQQNKKDQNKKKQQNQQNQNQQQNKQNKQQQNQNQQQKQQNKQQQNQNQQQKQQKSGQNNQQQKGQKKDQGQNQKNKNERNQQQKQQQGGRNNKERKRQGQGASRGKKDKKVDPALRAVFRALDELKARQRRLMRERYMQMRKYRRRSIKDW